MRVDRDGFRPACVNVMTKLMRVYRFERRSVYIAWCLLLYSFALCEFNEFSKDDLYTYTRIIYGNRIKNKFLAW